jgi:glyoxylase-like metal-dependent hydrolase (beta-lactamase superfamily II)
MVGHVTEPAARLLQTLPAWATLLRAPNPGPMTLNGTNTWVLRRPGSRPGVVVDPGPLDEEHLRAVARCGPIEAILLTHGHPDHTEGVARLSQLTGASVVEFDDELAVAGLHLHALDTPGHTRDSVCFVVNDEKSWPHRRGSRAGPVGEGVLTGDTILGRGTTVVAWPDGDLGDYLTSLRRLKALGPMPVLPGHGPPLADCAAAATYYLRHREARLDQVRAALAAGTTDAADVVRVVYADVDASLWPAAESSVRAQLAYLRDHP